MLLGYYFDTMNVVNTAYDAEEGFAAYHKRKEKQTQNMEAGNITPAQQFTRSRTTMRSLRTMNLIWRLENWQNTLTSISKIIEMRNKKFAINVWYAPWTLMNITTANARKSRELT